MKIKHIFVGGFVMDMFMTVSTVPFALYIAFIRAARKK